MRKIIKDKGILIDDIINTLKKEKKVYVSRLGIFEIKIIKGRKVWSTKERKMIPLKPFKQISFRPAKGVKEFIQ